MGNDSNQNLLEYFQKKINDIASDIDTILDIITILESFDTGLKKIKS